MVLREPGGGRTMRIEVVPEEDNFPAQVTVHLGRETNELIGGHIACDKLEVEGHSLSLRCGAS